MLADVLHFLHLFTANLHICPLLSTQCVPASVIRILLALSKQHSSDGYWGDGDRDREVDRFEMYIRAKTAVRLCW